MAVSLHNTATVVIPKTKSNHEILLFWYLYIIISSIKRIAPNKSARPTNAATDYNRLFISRFISLLHSLHNELDV